jgi:hypothetical protein
MYERLYLKPPWEGVLKAYNQSVNHIFYLAAAFAATTFVFSWGMGWKDIRKQKFQSHNEDTEDTK